jgi:hypothetical protein
MTSRNRTLLSIAFVSLCLAPSARADLMTYYGVGLCETVTVHAPGYLTDNVTVEAGQLLISYQGAYHVGWCVDLDQYSLDAEATEESYAVLPNHVALAYLFDTYADSVACDLDAAALGVAIWEVITESEGGTFNVYSGNFSITGNPEVAERAMTLLASIPSDYSPQQELIVLHSDSAQDMLIAPGGGLFPAPEPGSLALAAAGAIVLARRRRRRV